MLQDIFEISLYVGLSYAIGLAARAWWEVKLILMWIGGLVFFGLALSSLVIGQNPSPPPRIESLIYCAMVFIPLGYISGFPIIKQVSAWMENTLASDEFDGTYRKYAKNHKKTYSDEEIDSFYEHFQAKKAESQKSGRRTNSRTSYEQYSQHRRSHSRAQRHTPPQQDYRSEKDKMFDVLEVADKNASAKDLKSAYRTLARKYHPDILASGDLSEADLKTAEKRMQEINHAYDWLEDNGFA